MPVEVWNHIQIYLHFLDFALPTLLKGCSTYKVEKRGKQLSLLVCHVCRVRNTILLDPLFNPGGAAFYDVVQDDVLHDIVKSVLCSLRFSLIRFTTFRTNHFFLYLLCVSPSTFTIFNYCSLSVLSTYSDFCKKSIWQFGTSILCSMTYKFWYTVRRSYLYTYKTLILTVVRWSFKNVSSVKWTYISKLQFEILIFASCWLVLKWCIILSNLAKNGHAHFHVFLNFLAEKYVFMTLDEC